MRIRALMDELLRWRRVPVSNWRASASGNLWLIAQLPSPQCMSAIVVTLHVSDRGHAGFVTLAAEDYQLAALGQVVELHNVGQRLFALLRKAPGVTLHCPDRVANVARTQSHVEVTLESGETLTGRVLVAADGTHSALATVCGVDWQQDPYEQLAVIANVATSVAHEGRAFERFTQHGPLAMLPMSDGRCSLVWCHPLERREEVLSWSDERCCRGATRSFAVNSSRCLWLATWENYSCR